MLRFRHQGYQMKALLKVDEEYQISDHLKDHYKVEIRFLSLDFTTFSSEIKRIWLFDTIIRVAIWILSLDFSYFSNIS